MKNLIILIAFMFYIAGCATTYQKQGFTGGYSETQLGDNIFRVTFKGNAYTSNERAADFSPLRSAEVAIEKGFKYFIIVDSEQYAKTGSYTTPTKSHTTGSIYGSGNYAHGSSTTRTTGGQTYYYSKPRTTNTVVCFKDKSEIEGLVYDAEFIVRSIKNKYKLKD